jgi:hypothetical protein
MAIKNRGIYVNQDGTWVEVLQPTVNQTGTWANVRNGWTKKDGEWQRFFPASGTQEFTEPGTYTFTVPGGVYSITLDATGGGGGGGGSTGAANSNSGQTVVDSTTVIPVRYENFATNSGLNLDVVNEVASLYTTSGIVAGVNGLNRKPESAGLVYWIQQYIIHGNSLSAIAPLFHAAAVAEGSGNDYINATQGPAGNLPFDAGQYQGDFLDINDQIITNYKDVNDNGGNTGGAGGGGSSGFFELNNTMPVIPGETITIVVGAGGLGGHIASVGQAGCQTFISGQLASRIYAGGPGGLGNHGVYIPPPPPPPPYVAPPPPLPIFVYPPPPPPPPPYVPPPVIPPVVVTPEPVSPPAPVPTPPPLSGDGGFGDTGSSDGTSDGASGDGSGDGGGGGGDGGGGDG